MTNFFNTHKRLCITVISIIVIILFGLYICAIFIPGLWYGDAFLYRQDNVNFTGSDINAKYNMTVNPAEYGTDIDFSVNDNTKNYQVKYDVNNPAGNVEVFENGKLIYKGKAIEIENQYMLIDDEIGTSGMTSVKIVNKVLTEDELFPNPSQLYNWAVSSETDTRGKPYMLLLVILFSVVLFLDIKYPNLFWILEHRLDVDGGEPSDWYRFGQRAGYVLLPIVILVCIVLTFVPGLS